MDIDHIFKTDRQAIIALGVDAWKTDRLTINFADDAHPDMSQQFVLRLLHVSEEVRKMNDAGRIGFSELDTTFDAEGFWHWNDWFQN